MSGPRSKPAPQWLKSITPETQITRGVASRLLRRSFFYPASGSDTHTISRFAHRFCSFVCVDLYPPGIENFYLHSPPGYARVMEIPIKPDALVKDGWPPYSPPYEGIVYEVPETVTANLWIYELISDDWQHGENVMPRYKRIAVLMIYGECITTFEALYVDQKICPGMIFYWPCMEGALNVAMLHDGQAFPRLLERLPALKPEVLEEYNQARASYD